MKRDDLAARQCVPCRGGVPPLTPRRVEEYLAALEGWEHAGHRRIRRVYSFVDFKSALAHAVRVGEVADEQRHHPVLEIAWGRLGVEIWTHKIDGLTESDFVLAARIEKMTLERLADLDTETD